MPYITHSEQFERPLKVASSETPTRTARTLHIIFLAAATLLMTVLATETWPRIDRGISTAAGLATLGMLAVFPWTSRRSSSEQLLTPPTVMAVCLFLWHLGMVLPWLLGAPVRNPHFYLFSAPHMTPAVLVSCAAIMGYMLGDLLAANRRVPIRRRTRLGLSRRHRRRLMTVILLAYGVSVAAMFAEMALLGLGKFLSTPYAIRLRYFDEAFGGGRVFDLGMILASTSAMVMLLVASRRHLPWLIGLLAVHLVALGAMGYRSAAFPPFIGAVLAWQMRGNVIKPWVLGIFAIVVLAAVPVLRALREQPDQPVQALEESIERLSEEAIIPAGEELGRTFTVLVRTMTLVPDHESHGYGVSFVHGFIQGAPNPLPVELLERSDFERRGQWVARRTNPKGYYGRRLSFGYSIIAEGYYNFAATGAVAMMIIFGYALRRLYDAAMCRGRFLSLAMALMVFCWMFIGVRNDAASYVRRLGWGALLIIAIWLCSVWRIRRRTGPVR